MTNNCTNTFKKLLIIIKTLLNGAVCSVLQKNYTTCSDNQCVTWLHILPRSNTDMEFYECDFRVYPHEPLFFWSLLKAKVKTQQDF